MTFLLAAGAQIDLSCVKAQTPLFAAIKEKNFDIAKLLLQAGANPNGNSQNNSTLLFVAMNTRCLKLVEVSFFFTF